MTTNDLIHASGLVAALHEALKEVTTELQKEHQTSLNYSKSISDITVENASLKDEIRVCKEIAEGEFKEPWLSSYSYESQTFTYTETQNAVRILRQSLEAKERELEQCKKRIDEHWQERGRLENTITDLQKEAAEELSSHASCEKNLEKIIDRLRKQLARKGKK